MADIAKAEIRFSAEFVIKVESDEMTQEQMDATLASGGTMDQLARDTMTAIQLNPSSAPNAWHDDDRAMYVTDIVSLEREMGSVERAES